MKTLKVMGIIGIVWFSLIVVYDASLGVQHHAIGILYGLIISIVMVVQSNRLKRKLL